MKHEVICLYRSFSFFLGSDMARYKRSAHSHDQHPDHRPGNLGNSLSDYFEEILSERRCVRRQRFVYKSTFFQKCFIETSRNSGQYNGGEGVQRELLFRKPVTVSVLTERRVLQPYGMAGGEPGQCGLNLLIKKDGRVVNLGGKTAVDVDTGDVFSMKTPGGGGYGQHVDDGSVREEISPVRTFAERGSVFEYRSAQESV